MIFIILLLQLLLVAVVVVLLFRPLLSRIVSIVSISSSISFFPLEPPTKTIFQQSHSSIGSTDKNHLPTEPLVYWIHRQKPSSNRATRLLDPPTKTIFQQSHSSIGSTDKNNLPTEPLVYWIHRQKTSCNRATRLLEAPTKRSPSNRTTHLLTLKISQLNHTTHYNISVYPHKKSVTNWVTHIKPFKASTSLPKPFCTYFMKF